MFGCQQRQIHAHSVVGEHFFYATVLDLSEHGILSQVVDERHTRDIDLHLFFDHVVADVDFVFFEHNCVVLFGLHNPA